ncbi:hypothetical protein ACIGW7_40370 [Streptomyces sp. NPDC053253]|uniref:hypothetical protein n=1 Tax=Streptomyces sp. NPDC053253 TaxID=3365699 RepID=UPI0037D8B2EB
MSAPTKPDGFSTLQDAADAIVDEILRRRIDAAAARRQDRRLRLTQPESPWFDHKSGMSTEAEVEERALFLALFHLLGGGDAETFFRGSVRERYLLEQPATGEVVLSREAHALRPSWARWGQQAL